MRNRSRKILTWNRSQRKGISGYTTVPDFIRDSIVRLRTGNGLTHARAIAFQLILTLIPGIIFVVALAVRIGEGAFSLLVRETITTLAPGSTGEVLLTTFEQGTQAGRGNLLAIAFSGIAALISGTSAMSEFQRATSRLHGVPDDRPFLKRYGLALLQATIVGFLVAVAFVLIVVGENIAEMLGPDVAGLFDWLRWPAAFIAVTVGLAILLRTSPNRSQDRLSLVTAGGLVGTTGWFVVSIGLAAYLNSSSSLLETYGSLAGFVGLLIWAEFSSVAVLLGVAISVQLDIERTELIRSSTPPLPVGGR